MEFKASAEDISRMSHAHPTFAEAIKEAALAQQQITEHYTFKTYV
jgi:dihydrolipoamide dehydrogenase